MYFGTEVEFSSQEKYSPNIIRKFMLKSYFRNGQQVIGQRVYETWPCFQEFRKKILVYNIKERIPKSVENVRQVKDNNPHSSLKRQFQQTDLSNSTC